MSDALDAFVAKKAEFDELIVRLAALSDEHFVLAGSRSCAALPTRPSRRANTPR